MLWSCGGEVGQGVIKAYDTSVVSRPTTYGEQLPYLRELIEKTFVVEHLLFARLAVMTDDVFIPHRDYVELTEKPGSQRASYRLYVPLVTNEDCLFIEEDVVYRMLRGEVWILDVSRVHSSAVLSDVERTHLLLDFGGAVGGVADLLRFDVVTAPGIPPTHRVDRPALGDRDREALLALASVVDLDNVYQVLGILTKKSYRKKCGEDYVWETLAEIGRRSGDPEVDAKVKEMYEYSVQARQK